MGESGGVLPKDPIWPGVFGPDGGDDRLNPNNPFREPDDDDNGTPFGTDDECAHPKECAEPKSCCRGCKRRECEEEDENALP